MFRKPREAATPKASQTPVRPSTGRAPTPPSSTSQKQIPIEEDTTYSMATSTPLLGRSKTTSRKTPTMAAGKVKTSGNGNIMSFFKRAESTIDRNCGAKEADTEDTLFLEGSPIKEQTKHTMQIPTPPREEASPRNSDVVMADTPTSRFNEASVPNKRRRTEEAISLLATPTDTVPHGPQSRGPFVDDSDSDEEDIKSCVIAEAEASNGREHSRRSTSGSGSPSEFKQARSVLVEPDPPPLKRESTSVGEIDDFDGIEDFIDDEFPEEGEEFLERRWMEEQAELETGLEEQDDGAIDVLDGVKEEPVLEAASVMPQDAGSTTCPICGGYTTGMNEQQVSTHVNDCLDGQAKPLPQYAPSLKNESASESIKRESDIPGQKRFQRAAIARPGQDNPFGLSSTPSASSSAFSKLMSGHAEDAAWATAAASEQASRGKPAYQRTCPFYKIMPGFFICVDAFRYGAVAGCNAYFLSHFHSDHYIGLTSSWCHGPIYCSHVTANLVRRQLRVDPKWVVDLEFDKKMTVPGTQGVDVTMIPANHCPGSSLYLFEKVVGKGKNPKIQRVLHCGDFRACPAHVQHPKLRPDIIDTVTGRGIAQQKLDVCYLDTTYLTPKYAFPSQEDVIKACADMCVSLSKDFIDENDSWEQTKKERAGDGMVKFVRKTSIKEETDEEMEIKIEDQPTKGKKARGRLLVIVGTYSIGKERICLGVAKALNSKIYAPPNKQKICAALEDPELSARMTNDPLEAQVHMQMLMEIRAETLADYLTGFKPHFSRVVGFRPSGWNYRPPNSRFTESPSVQTVLHSDNWKSRYTMAELVPQRGSTREAHCFGVPYSEHSSFRELTMFCCALRIDKIIPTVNVGSAKSRERMKGWCEKWAMDKKKSGLYKVQDGQRAW
ncbi:DNA cross-link repair 1A protein, partial [Lecanoromycetidae sp. Uapishka_2]